MHPRKPRTPHQGPKAHNAKSSSVGSAGGRSRVRDSAEARPERILPPPSGRGASEVIQTTVEGLGYQLVEIERLPRGLLRISIDRLPDRTYPVPSEFVTVDDCELVTRQLQWVLEVEQVSYERLEVASPGLDRPLLSPLDWARFAGLEVDVTFKLPFQGRRKFRGVLASAEAGPRLIIAEGANEQALDFTLEEVREARLVPVVNFKGRQAAAQNGEQEP